MFTESIYYGLRCDRCMKHYYSDEDYTSFSDKSEAMENAVEDGWIEYNGKHYCPDCSIQDESGESCPKPPIPFVVYEVFSYILKYIDKYGNGVRNIDENDTHYLICAEPYNPILAEAHTDYIKTLLRGRELIVEKRDKYPHLLYKIKK